MKHGDRVIAPGTFISCKENSSAFLHYPGKRMGMVIKLLEPRGGWEHPLYEILYTDGTTGSEYEGFITYYYEVFP
jgi:hypothetical protein